MFFVFLSVPFL